MAFKPIPDEGVTSGFTRRQIRKTGDANVLLAAEKLLQKFISDGDEMLISELNDLTAALHRSSLQVQRVRQKVLLKRLKRSTRTDLKIED
jgi:hypothetical protein